MTILLNLKCDSCGKWYPTKDKKNIFCVPCDYHFKKINETPKEKVNRLVDENISYIYSLVEGETNNFYTAKYRKIFNDLKEIKEALKEGQND